ncbi:hypothetical protein SAMN00017477_1059 [Peptoniphilus asaccharolyticus DSM 20463]|uniref:Uncharacterized protein n=1 Tax=Peptoniphilus asaccharolyticus DSM 20463 TaxID=573058 RepID=A0A1W1V2H9_PEPAS|nr:hypothetical protein [Peptoniphilus asaccharolyticus]MBL7575552.1 hypothetical protein [Peptoniphilus asaccharolyticus]SMB87231.1 hypothetical protein SAMN00017477_1059 [Peptoniphilus asaccharolyticus DSM 20463]
MRKVNFEFNTTEAFMVYDLILNTYETLKKNKDKGYKLYEPLLKTIEEQYPSLKEHREIVKTID